MKNFLFSQKKVKKVQEKGDIAQSASYAARGEGGGGVRSGEREVGVFLRERLGGARLTETRD